MMRAICLGLGLLLAAPADAQEVPPVPPGAVVGAEPVAERGGKVIDMSVTEAVHLGLRRNRDIESAYLARVVQKFALEVAEDRFVPDFTVGADIDRSFNDDRDQGDRRSDALATEARGVWQLPTGAQMTVAWSADHVSQSGYGAVDDRGSGGWMAEVTQPLLKGGGIDVGMAPVRLARLTEAVNRLSLKSTVIDTVNSIITAYYDFILAHQQEAIARRSLERARKLMTINRALIDAGRMAENEMVQTDLNVAKQELALLAAESRAEKARLALTTLLRLDPGARIRPAHEIRAEPVRIDVGLAQDLARENRPDILSRSISLRQARIRRTLAENGTLWTLDAYARRHESRSAARYTDAAHAPYDTASTTVGLSLSIPLNDQASAENELAARVAVQQGEIALEKLREQVVQQVRDAVRTVHVSWRQLELSRTTRRLADRALEAEIVKLRNGRTTNFQVMSYEDDLRAAEVAELTATIDYLKALTTLDSVLGTTLQTWSISLND